jgi:hypothetical protein
MCLNKGISSGINIVDYGKLSDNTIILHTKGVVIKYKVKLLIDNNSNEECPLKFEITESKRYVAPERIQEERKESNDQKDQDIDSSQIVDDRKDDYNAEELEGSVGYQEQNIQGGDSLSDID